MEIAIPLIALGGLYIVSKQSGSESFANNESSLPNTNVPDRNYPPDQVFNTPDVDLSSKLSTVNQFGGGAYTDKYFDPNRNMAATSVTGSANRGSKSGQYYSLAGGEVGMDYFRHNNMAPYFGSHIRGQSQENATESIMDNYVGTGSQIYQKKEVAPLFAPGENVQYAYGAPNNSDFYQSRVNPSLRMANTKPFDEIHVAPGLGAGYGTEGVGGFNSGLFAREQWNEKTVDELRAANKPKSSGLGLFGHEGPANSHIKNIADSSQHGIYEKKLPNQDFEMTPSRYMTTTGVEKGPMLNAIPIDRYTTRPDTSVSYSGAAGSSVSAQTVTGEYMESKNIALGAVPSLPAYASGKGGSTEADYGYKTNVAYPNNRTSNQNDGYFGIFSGPMGAVVSPLLDMLRPSRKENSVGNLRPYQNAKSTVEASYMFNPNDRPAPTIRETTEKGNNHLYVNRMQHGGGYEVNPQQAIHNQRDTTTDYYYAGGSSAGERGRQPRAYDAEYRQRNNDIKSSTIQGYMVQGNMSLMNNYVNAQSKNKDPYLANNREVAPTMPYYSPSTNSIGQLQGQNKLYQNIQLDRNTSDINTVLKSNPYSLDVTRGI
jgi:hypothetical protein